MTNTTWIASAALLLTTACVETEPEVVPTQQPTRDLSCLDAVPTSVPSTVLVHGTLIRSSDVGIPGTIPGATVRAVVGGSVFDTATSDPYGEVDLQMGTGSRPIDAHFEIDGEGLVPARLYRNVPLAAHDPLWIGHAPGVGRLDAIADALGTELDPAMGTIEIALGDCAYQGLPGAVISVSSRSGDEPWAVLDRDASWQISDVAGDTAGRWGASVIAAVNIPPGLAMVTAEYEGVTLPIAMVDVAPGGWTFVEMRPGAIADQ